MGQGHSQTKIAAARGVLAVSVSSRRTFARHSHAQYGIGVFDAGGHRSASGRGMVEAGPGDVITANPAEIHDGAPLGNGLRRWRMLYFDESVLSESVSGLADHASTTYEFHAPVLRDGRAKVLFDHLFALCDDRGCDSADRLLREQCLLGLLARLGERIRPTPSPGVAGGIARAKAAIDASPARRFTLAQLSRLSGINRYQTIRMFARATGLTPHAYLLQRRVELAHDLIRGGSNLVDAATAAGFSDQSHLTRAFIARFGYTPGTYANAFR